MNPVSLLFNLLFFALIFSIVFNNAKRRRFNAMPRQKTVKTEKKDMFQVYSSKNKDCYEHEAKIDIKDPKRKKKWSLWNEPSWDDELK